MKLSGKIISGLVILFMLFDSITKIIKEPHVMKAQAELGWPSDLVVRRGVAWHPEMGKRLLSKMEKSPSERNES